MRNRPATDDCSRRAENSGLRNSQQLLPTSTTHITVTAPSTPLAAVVRPRILISTHHRPPTASTASASNIAEPPDNVCGGECVAGGLTAVPSVARLRGRGSGPVADRRARSGCRRPGVRGTWPGGWRVPVGVRAACVSGNAQNSVGAVSAGLAAGPLGTSSPPWWNRRRAVSHPFVGLVPTRSGATSSAQRTMQPRLHPAKLRRCRRGLAPHHRRAVSGARRGATPACATTSRAQS